MITMVLFSRAEEDHNRKYTSYPTSLKLPMLEDNSNF